MTSIRTVALACMTTAMMALPLAASAQTGSRNQDTYFTFSQPVELPNATLPAGTYLFQLVDSPSNRHIVRIMTKDRQKVYATLMAIPAYSTNRPPDKPEVRFMESPASQANAIKIWFYPGNATGHEFIYPRNQALKLAKASGESVLTTKSDKDVTSTVAESDLTRVNPEGQDVAADMSRQRASENARSEMGETATQSASARSSATSQQPDTPPPPATSASRRTTATPGATGTSGTATTAARTRRTLPRTAGVLPLIGLIGLGSLAGSRMVRRARRA